MEVGASFVVAGGREPKSMLVRLMMCRCVMRRDIQIFFRTGTVIRTSQTCGERSFVEAPGRSPGLMEVGASFVVAGGREQNPCSCV